jgi:uncharacterized protein (TIGR00304 family)
MEAQTLYEVGTTLIFAGALIITIARAILSSKSRKTGKVRGGGAIIIGPIPIVFGTDKQSLKTILVLSTILTVLLIVLVITLHFLSR